MRPQVTDGAGNNHCPYCLSELVTEEEDEIDEMEDEEYSSLSRRAKCDSCGKEWFQNFQYMNWEEV